MNIFFGCYWSFFLGRFFTEVFASKFVLTYNNVRVRIGNSRRDQKQRQNETTWTGLTCQTFLAEEM